MRGFAATLDSVVAIAFLFFALALVATQTYEPRAPGSIYLKQVSLDTLTVLEKTGGLEGAVEGNATSFQEILEATPHLACMSVSIVDSEGNSAASASKMGCNETTGLDIQVATIPLSYRGEYYTARAESWFRKEG